MHVVMVPVGSAGDVLPFVALGRSLRQRGHEVCVLANEVFRNIIEGAELKFVPLGTEELYSAIVNHPHLWDPHRSSGYLFEQLIAYTSMTFDAVMEQARPKKSVLLCSPTAFGALLAQEKLNLPTATLNVQPRFIFSAHYPIVTPSGRRLDWMPMWLRRGLVFLASRQMDRNLRRPLDGIRSVGFVPLLVAVIADRALTPLIGRLGLSNTYRVLARKHDENPLDRPPIR